MTFENALKSKYLQPYNVVTGTDKKNLFEAKSAKSKCVYFKTLVKNAEASEKQ